jgi:hypothetical protein
MVELFCSVNEDSFVVNACLAQATQADATVENRPINFISLFSAFVVALFLVGLSWAFVGRPYP